MYKHLIAVILLALVLLISCGSSAQDVCLTGMETYIPLIDDVLDEWGDAVDVAMSTSRINLGDQVQVLQAIQRNAEDIEPPGCMAEPHENVTKSMDVIIQLFLDFMSDVDYEPTAVEELDISMAMLTLEGFPEAIKEYEADPEAYVQKLFDLIATEEAMTEADEEGSE